MPAAAIAAAAWSWVEKMLHDAQRTSAPSATSVSMSTAVWMVMCSEPVMRAPASGWRLGVAVAQGHEARHLVLGELDLLAAELGEREVGDLEVGEPGGRGGVRWWLSSGPLSRRNGPGADTTHGTRGPRASIGLDPVGPDHRVTAWGPTRRPG